jgi:UDP-glucose 4-epimerase
MRIIVFGGSGFLGSHCCDALTAAGHEVKIFDIKQSPYLKPGQEMVIGDILNESEVNRVLEGQDVAYNFAAIMDIDEAWKRPLDTVKYNVLGNSIILEAARKAKIQRFIFASSIYVYSERGSFYRSSKQACELFVEDYWRVYHLPYTILRYGSIYGSRSDDRNIVYRFIKQALTEGKITYPGTGDEQRELIHVEDAALASVEILGKEYENERIILTGRQSMTIRDFLIMIKEIMGNRIEVVFEKSDSSNHYQITPYYFNPAPAKKLTLGLHTDLGQGILNCLSEMHDKLRNG